MASITSTDVTSVTSASEAPPPAVPARLSKGMVAALTVLALAVAAVPYLINERFAFHIAILVCFAAIGACSLHLIVRTGHVSRGENASAELLHFFFLPPTHVPSRHHTFS